MDGILNIDKPRSQTSYRTVAIVKRLSGERRVGHAGTLDPDATGVLPVCLGQGTRVTEYLMDATKSYRAEIEFGVATDTYDASGEVTRRGDPAGITREQVEVNLSLFLGRKEQTPPMYSAVKHRGQRLYELARAGIEVPRKSRPAIIHRIEVTDWQPPVVTIEVECGKGTYIRSLAHDLGEALGCGANLKNLIRLSYGPFNIREAVTLPQLEGAFRHGDWQRFIHPVDSVLSHWKAVVADEATEKNIRNGVPVILESAESRARADAASLSPAEVRSETHCRAYTRDGRFLGVLRFDPAEGHWQPKKVFL